MRRGRQRSAGAAPLVVTRPPARVLSQLFLALIVLGTMLLKLPISTTAPLSWLDALFTATSAVTVTGLVVADTGTAFTHVGHLVLLVLMQLGALGIITFATLILALLGQRVGLRQQLLLREDLNQTSLGDLGRLARLIAAVVLVMEAGGTALLAVRFVPLLGWSEGLFQALFHAVSAFCNAGFSLLPDSLIGFAGDPLVNLVVPFLIIVGGIGFNVLSDLRRWCRPGYRKLTLHTRLMLLGTAALLAVAFVGFLALEWNNPNTLGQHAAISDRLLIAWFQAVTPRSAGFSTVDPGLLRDGTALLMIVLMFIGGGSTSAAGGIKVATFMVLIIASIAYARGRPDPTAFGRSIAPVGVLKVLALTFVSMTVLLLGAFLLSISQALPFLDLLFEAVSAAATCGLSRGITAELDGVGRCVLIVLMYLGRIGPLVLGVALATVTAERIRHPRGRVYLG
jgi:trk system potassium uptake protein TrkH